MFIMTINTELVVIHQKIKKNYYQEKKNDLIKYQKEYNTTNRKKHIQSKRHQTKETKSVET